MSNEELFRPFPDQWVVRSDVLHELDEARLEIERHHRDFERVRYELDEYFASDEAHSGVSADRTLTNIRNIVG